MGLGATFYSFTMYRNICLAIVILCLYMIHNEMNKSSLSKPAEYNETVSPDSEASSVNTGYRSAPCGSTCSYDEHVMGEKGGIYPQLQKEVNCDNIMKRMAYQNNTVTYPPPEYPPQHLIEEFTMFGKMPLRNLRYLKDEWKNDRARRYGYGYVNRAINKVMQGEQVNTYKSGLCVQQTLKKYKNVIEKKHGLVIGTLDPWLESILLAYGADKVTTLEYGRLVLDHRQLEAYTPYAYAERYLRGDPEQFDFGATFSSLEHSGLGRYGDPLNPYGDLEAMAQVWCMIKPGGLFAIGIPYNSKKNYLSWNANRVYSTERLKHLTANWESKELVKCDDIHAFIILTKSG